MAEKLKDAEDRLLESMFAAEPIADDGFSRKVVTRLRRRIWLRRLALPVAMLVGGSIAIKPASEVLVAGSRLLVALPDNVIDAQISWLPDVQNVAISGSVLQVLIFGSMLLAAAVFGSRFILD